MKSYFLNFSKNIYSQCGEDGIIEELLNLLQINEGIVVEFGAMDGYALSNTYGLWKNKKFKSILIEMSSIRERDLNKIQNEMDNVECLICQVSPNKQDTNSIDNILVRSKFSVNNENLVLMSIDVDSCDYQIFESIEKFFPKIIIIETNTNYNYDEEYVSVDNGCSLLSVKKLAEKKGYTLICHTGNAFLLRNDLIDLLPKEDYSLKNLFCNNECVNKQQSIK